MFKRKKRKFQPEIFRESVDAISNPGCGWYHLYTFDAADLDAPLYVACPEEELVLLRISVRSAREREISGAELKNIARILQFFRDEQKGIILRFVYDMEGKGMEAEPAAFSLVQKHMQQLGIVIRQFIPFVLAVQGILVGNWGEMHGSKFLTEQYLKELTKTMMDAVGDGCFLAVRTIQQFHAVAAGLSEQQCGQLALFNDGIFGSVTDLGTYGVGRDCQQQKQMRKDALKWQAQHAQCRLNGGEVLAGVKTEADRQLWQDAGQAVSDLADMHISYLNSTYQQDVLQAWKEQEMTWPGMDLRISAYDYIGRHLGYRFVVRSAIADRKQMLHIVVENCGFAELCEDVDCYLIWKQGNKEVRQRIHTDVRQWKSKKQTELVNSLEAVGKHSVFSSDGESVFCYLCLQRRRDGRYLRFANEGAGEILLIGGFS